MNLTLSDKLIIESMKIKNNNLTSELNKYAFNFDIIIENLNKGIFHSVNLLTYIFSELHDSTKNVIAIAYNYHDIEFDFLTNTYYGDIKVIGIGLQNSPSFKNPYCLYIHTPFFKLFEKDQATIYLFSANINSMEKIYSYDEPIEKEDNLVEIKRINKYWSLCKYFSETTEKERRMIKLKQIIA